MRSKGKLKQGSDAAAGETSAEANTEKAGTATPNTISNTGTCAKGGQGAKVEDIIGSVEISTLPPRKAGLMLGSGIAAGQNYVPAIEGRAEAAANLIGGAPLGKPAAPSTIKSLGTRVSLRKEGLPYGGPAASAENLVGGVTLAAAPHERGAPAYIALLNSSIPKFKPSPEPRDPAVTSLLKEMTPLHRPEPASKDRTSQHQLLNSTVEQEVASGLDVLRRVSLTERGLLEEVLALANEGRERSAAEGAIPRSLGALEGNVLTLIAVEPKGSNWHLLVAHLVRVLLEELVGSGVKVFVRKATEEVGAGRESIDSLERASLGRLNLRGVVEVIDLRENPYRADHVLELVRSRLPVLYTHGPGALIIAVSQKEVGRRLYAAVKRESSGPTYLLDLVRVADRLESMANLLILGSASERARTSGDSAGEAPQHVIRRRYEALRRTLETLSYFVKRQVSGDRFVDTVQYRLKVAAFSAIIHKAVVHELREHVRKGGKLSTPVIYGAVANAVKGLKVATEEALDSGSGRTIIPDITFEPKEGHTICVEVETLVGSGEPLKKVDESIEKYLDGAEGYCSEVWVVLPPEAALIHMPGLKRRLEAIKVLSERYAPVSVRVKVLTLRPSEQHVLADAFGWGLVDLQEFEGRVKSALRGGSG